MVAAAPKVIERMVKLVPTTLNEESSLRSPSVPLGKLLKANILVVEVTLLLEIVTVPATSVPDPI